MKKTSTIAEVLPKQAVTVNLDEIRKSLSCLGLNFASDMLVERLEQSVKNGMSPALFLQELLKDEYENREERRIKTALKLSNLPSGQTISGFDYAYQPSLQRSRLEYLSTCEWIKQKKSLIILGPPGVGKTHLAVALGVKAVEAGFSVLFRSLDELLYEMRKDADFAPNRLRRKGYMKAALLVIDEMGFQPLTRYDANLFFRLVNYRYQRGSICITSNKSIKEWTEMFAGDEVLTSALLDRLLHQSEVLNISGRSYRLKDLESSLKQK